MVPHRIQVDLRDNGIDPQGNVIEADQELSGPDHEVLDLIAQNPLS